MKILEARKKQPEETGITVTLKRSSDMSFSEKITLNSLDDLFNIVKREGYAMLGYSNGNYSLMILDNEE